MFKEFIFSTLYLLISIDVVVAQQDSVRTLPSFEISSLRSSKFSIGQVSLEEEKTAHDGNFALGMQHWIQYATPLSFRTYGTGIASISARGTGASHSAILWNGINIQNTLSGISDLPILDVGVGDKVSVKLGASTALFGSGAIGSTIVFDNEAPSTTGLQGNLHYGEASFNNHQFGTKLQYKHSFFSGQTKVSSQNGVNDFLFRNSASLGNPLQRAQNAAFNFLNVNQNFYFDLNRNQKIKFIFWYSQNLRENTPIMTARNDQSVLKDTSFRFCTEWSGFFWKKYFQSTICIFG